MPQLQYSKVNNAIITLTDTDDSTKGRHFKSRFIQPGLAGYPGQFGNALIKKENLDKFVWTLRSKPVTINHKDKIEDKDKVGIVNNVWFNPDDGWYWCDGIIFDDEAINLINNGWSVSCAYDFTKADNSGGTENNIPYDIEFLDGEFNHLALVDNPRYEGANIVFNSKVENEDKWITIKPNGEENKGKHLLVKDGETPKEAIDRVYKKEDKSDTKDGVNWKDKDYTNVSDDELREKLYDITQKLDKKHGSFENAPYSEKEEYYFYNNMLNKGFRSKGNNPDTKDGEEDFEKGTKSTKKDENRHQKVRDLEDKAYKEFKTMYDNYIDKDGMEGWGGIPASRFDKAIEQFDKKYKDAFDKLESDRFVSFEDFAKRENKQSNTKDGEEMKIENWNEQDHPRDEQGKFTDKNGGSSNIKQKYINDMKNTELSDLIRDYGENDDFVKEKIKEFEEQYKETEDYIKAVIKDEKERGSHLQYFKDKLNAVQKMRTEYKQQAKLEYDLYRELTKNNSVQNSLTDTILNAIAELIIGE